MRAIAGCVLICLLVACVEPNDDAALNQESAPAVERLVTLAPHLTELAFSAGAGDLLVGVSAYSDYPPAATAIPIVSDGFRIDAEAMLAADPDLVLAWGGGGQASSLELLDKLGIDYVEIETRRLSDVAPALVKIGALTGSADEAERAARDFETALQVLATSREPVDVFYQISSEPPFYTINDEHFISDLIRLCGGTNVFADLPTTVATVSVEAVVLADPDVILHGAGDDEVIVWRGFENMSVSETGYVFGIPGDVVARPSVRLAEGARAVCAALDSIRESAAP